MQHRIRFGNVRTSAIFVFGLLLCAVLTVSTLGTASANSTTASADTATKYLGVFRQTSPSEIPSGTASRYGVTPASVLWFDSWATGNAFNAAEARTLWNQGVMMHFTWEPWNTALSVDDPAQIHLQDIVNGKWDSYIKARGAEFASVGAPIMVRWGHEFNGNWYPWGIVNNNSDPSLYIRAYRHVHDLVVAAGATNVQWVWCFNNGSTPGSSFNDPAQSYPGDAYVDWVAVDGYNWGLGPSWDPSGNHWTSFDTMFASAYAKARAIAPKRPVMIGEVGSSEDGGSKAQWINDMSTALQSGRYPDLKLVTYFDQDKEELWSGTSSPAAQAAFTTWVNQSYMKGTGTDLAKVAAQYEGTGTSGGTTGGTTTGGTTSGSTSGGTTGGSTTGGTGGKTCSAVLHVDNQWNSGFTATVTVKAGSSAISGWTVGWTWPGSQQVAGGWNATLTQSGSTVSAKNMSYNGSVAASGSTSFGFQGTASGTFTAPALSCTAS
jgi:beta-mannanase